MFTKPRKQVLNIITSEDALMGSKKLFLRGLMEKQGIYKLFPQKLKMKGVKKELQLQLLEKTPKVGLN